MLNPTVLGDSGASFSVVVSNTAGSVTSAAASLCLTGSGGGTPTPLPLDAHFDIWSDGFTYADDVFRATNKPDYASGAYFASGGFTGGALQVAPRRGQRPNISKMSGGWQRSFVLASPDARDAFVPVPAHRGEYRAPTSSARCW